MNARLSLSAVVAGLLVPYLDMLNCAPNPLLTSSGFSISDTESRDGHLSLYCVNCVYFTLSPSSPCIKVKLLHTDDNLTSSLTIV